MADSTIDQLPLLLAPSGADVAASKTNTDYRIRVGEANGIATLDSSTKLPLSNLPTHNHDTLYAPIVHTHTLSQLTQSGATVGQVPQWDGAFWIPGTVAGGATWGTITGTLSSQTDLQNALNLKAPLASPTFTGTVTAPTLDVGDDATIKDINVTNTLGIAGKSNANLGFIQFGTNGNGFGWNGTNLVWGANTMWHSGNFTPANKSDVGHTHDDRYYTESETNTLLAAKLDDSQATATGLAVLGAASQDAARDAIGIYIQSGDPGSVTDGSLWIW